MARLKGLGQACGLFEWQFLLRRSLGDADLKAEGLTALPEVSVRELDEGDLFVVAASDGFWDKVDNTEAVNMVHDTGAPVRPPKTLLSHLSAVGQEA